MDSSEQQPQPQATPDKANEETFAQEVAPPLYEFAPDMGDLQEPIQPGIAPVDDAQEPKEARQLDQQALEQAIRQGLIYPPPPSYYQNMSAVIEQPVPAASGAPMSSVRPAPLNYTAPRPAYQPRNPAPGASAPKRSRAWIWIVVAVLGVGLVGCGLLSWGAYTIFDTAYQSASGSIQVVEDFYANLQSQDYQAAYQDLDMPNLTLAQFTQQARQADREGTIQSYQPQTPSLGVSQNAPDLSHFSYEVKVTRAHASYTALIAVSQEGNSWKITNFGRL